MKLKFYYELFALLILLVGCNDDAILLKYSVSELSNDCIKRSLPIAPNIVGSEIEFAYAMAIPKNIGSLKSVQVVASIPGATGTYFDPNSYNTNSSGQDIPVLVASESTTDGGITSTSFIVDTCAATLRYYYIIPKEARGKEVSFEFSSVGSNGEIAIYKMGPYKISKMDIARNLTLDNERCYISFNEENQAIKIYSKEEVEANSSILSGIDIMYNYSSKKDLTHSFYTATTPSQFMDEVSLPSGFSNNTKMLKVYGLRDRQLSDLQYSHFVDDLDFEKINMNSSINYILNLKEESGVWIETSNKKYRAFVYVNKAPNNQMTISVKRYAL